MIITLPNPEALRDNNIFNCNLNTLKKFFPPEGFPDPRNINYYNIGFYLKNSDEYIRRFEDEKSVNRLGFSKLYYKMMEEDIGINEEYLKPINPIKAMIRFGYEDVVIHVQSSSVDKEYIDKLIERLLNYGLLSNKNLAFAKDELKRMRLSITAMQKRVCKVCDNDSIELIDKLVEYFRFCLDEYQTYIKNKFQAENNIYYNILSSVSKDYLKLYNYIPSALDKYLKEPNKIIIL